jgi:protein O-GlcNAc transferase
MVHSHTTETENAREELWRKLDAENDWCGLRNATSPHLNNPALALRAALFYAKAHRSEGRGDEANKVLKMVASSKFEASHDTVAVFTEELLQSCLLTEASLLIKRLKYAKSPFYHYLACIAYRMRGDWRSFDQALAEAEKIQELRGAALAQKIWGLISRSQLTRAENLIRPIRDNDHPGMQKLAARIENARGHAESAINRLYIIKHKLSFDWEWPTLLATALVQKAKGDKDHEQNQQIEDLFKQALSRQPAQPEAYEARARWYLTRNKPELALQDCQTALKYLPWADKPVLTWLQQLVQKREWAAATAWLSACRAQIDTPLRAGAALDVLRLGGATNQEIIAEYEESALRFADSIDFQRAAGAALQVARQYDRAASCYTRALAIDPDDAGTINNLAMLERNRGDNEAAVARWRRLLQLGTFNDTVLLNLGHVLRERGDHPDALRCFESVLSRDPSNASALRGKAEVAFAAGDLDIAWENAAGSLKKDPINPLAWRTAAGVAGRREGPEAALALLKKGVHLARPVLEVRRALLGRLLASEHPERLVNVVQEWMAADGKVGDINYLMMLADVQMEAGLYDDCERTLKDAVRADASKGSEALIRFYQSRGREGIARRVAEQLVKSEPHEQRHWGLYAEVLYRQARYDEAIDTIDKGLCIDPNRLSLVRQKVGMLLERERQEEAVLVAASLAHAEPMPPQISLAVEALQRSQRLDEAVALLRQYLVSQPDNRSLTLMLVDVLSRKGDWAEALFLLEDLCKKESGNFEAVRRLALALLEHGKTSAAFDLLEQLIEKAGERPDLVEAIIGVLLEQGAIDQARQRLADALNRFPKSLPILLMAIRAERRAENASAEIDLLKRIIRDFPPQQWIEAIMADCIRVGLIDELQQGLNNWRSSEPGNTAPWWAAYAVTKELKRYQHARIALAKVEILRGPRAEVHAARASLFKEEGLLTQAVEEQRKAVEMKPDYAPYVEALLNYLVMTGDFDSFDPLMVRIEHMLGDRRYGHFANFFFNINCHPDWTSEKIWRFYRDWYQRAVKLGLPPLKPQLVSPDPKRKLRIGYLSPDFRRHSVAYFSEPLLCRHDREQFELFAYAHLERGLEDAYTARFKTYFDHWLSVQHMGDAELERRIREDRIDILIDLAGHTTNNRLMLMLRRPAPVQASWIFGAGQTTGLPQVDYLLADAVTLPPHFEGCVAERIARLTTPGLPYRPGDDYLPPEPLPCMSQDRIVLGVLSRPLRTNRRCIAAWAEILKRAPSSVLRFDHHPYQQPMVRERLAAQFAELGITAERLEFANTRPHWSALSNIDLLLDPLPTGSGTVVSDGLWMERLAVTLRGRPAMGLAATAQLTALGLANRCVADSDVDYVEKTVFLLENRDVLRELTSGLRARMQSSALMDYERYGKDVARLYRKIWSEWCLGHAVRPVGEGS